MKFVILGVISAVGLIASDGPRSSGGIWGYIWIASCLGLATAILSGLATFVLWLCNRQQDPEEEDTTN
jgi:hypothetical protein